jgi:(2Fe-2S) ferredoxin
VSGALRALARALRQSRRFLVILEGELLGGFLHKRASACELVARALRPPHRVLHTRQDWLPATEVLQIVLRSSLRIGDLPSASLRENIRCNAAGCLDRCEFGPNMVIYPEGVWYRYESTQDIDEILETHVKSGGRVRRLMLQPDQLPPKH